MVNKPAHTPPPPPISAKKSQHFGGPIFQRVIWILVPGLQNTFPLVAVLLQSCRKTKSLSTSPKKVCPSVPIQSLSYAVTVAVVIPVVYALSC